MAGEFAQLLPFKWRDQSYPVTRIKVALAHDLVEHKYWAVDGARVEDTGIAAVRIEAVIPIANTIFPGKNEGWKAGKLYPNALRKFIIDFGNRKTGYVQHPEFGEIACKPEKMEFELAGDRQDSSEIHVSWIETKDEQFQNHSIPSPVQDIELAASDLKSSGKSLKALAPKLPEFTYDIEALGRQLTAVVDTATVLEYRTAGIVNRIIYQAHRLELAIDRATSNPSTRFTQLRPFSSTAARVKEPQRPQEGKQSTATLWAAYEALQTIVASAFAVRNKLLSRGGIGLYVVPADTTLAGLMPSLPSNVSMADVINFNPNLMRSPVVSRGAVVRYPLPA